MTITQPPEPEAVALRRRIDELEARVQAQSADNERLRREHAAMVASERELTAIFRAMTDVVMVVDRHGRYLKIAPTAPDLLYAPSHELVGKTILEALGPEAHAQFVPPINRALDRREIVTLEYFLPIAAKQIWFQGAISPMTEDAVVFVARNITDLKEALRHTIKQEELIHAQSAALAELSSPLIPIDDNIVVMPLVGALDEARIERITESLLTGIIEHRTRFAILDITGLADTSAPLAEGLVRAARSARLLGARVLLTGMRPRLAQEIAVLGTDLGDVECHNTLQRGIAAAMATFQAIGA